MGFSEFEKRRVSTLLEDYCDRRVPARVRDQLRLGFSFRGDSVTLFEVRPAFQRPEEWVERPFAQFRRSPTEGHWSLYCRAKRRWHLFEPHPRSRSLEELLQVVDEDSAGFFYG